MRASNLNIKLQKFKDYDSSADIYTFKTEFENVYSRSTPRRLLPDVLKNNFLEDPDLSLAKKENGNIKQVYTFLENIKPTKDIKWFDKNYQFNQRPDEISKQT